ncbi:MAG: glycosyltransferase [Planctomycetales bacterium]|nr:glycosyltransferase [Planctomycetales bacterium]
MINSPNQNRTGKPTAVYSLRNVDPHVCRCLGYELEDAIASMHDARIYAPQPMAGSSSIVDRLAKSCFQKLTKKRYKLTPLPIPEPLADPAEHDLFFMFCQNPSDARFVTQRPHWRKSFAQTACWVDEIWLANAKKFPRQLRWLEGFDYLFITFQETVDYLQREGFNAFYTPGGIDCFRFSSCQVGQARPIDVLSMGRKAPNTHKELFELSLRDEINYVYDTSSLPNVKNHVDHRTLMAKQTGRARCFFVQRAKADAPKQTNGQVELGSRYFEGCAAGAILVGEKLDVDAFKDQFGWQDSVIEMPYDSSDISPIMDLLNSDPAVLDQMHARNLRHSLLTHDWVYRWEKILSTMGLPATAAMAERKNRLHEMADSLPKDEDAAQSSVA